MTALYDTIGLDYAQLRRPDPRIAAVIDAALGDAKSVLNVGAGAGSYEPENRIITAVEPSAEMIAQRPPSDAILVQANAESLAFADDTFDAAMVSLTIHHWSDKPLGVAEMRRVTKGALVFLTYDPAFRDFWLLDYFPELATLDEGQMPPISDYEKWLGNVTITLVPIPHDCSDGFLAAYWRRPAAYLEERVRASMSSFWKINGVEEGVARLKADLENGEWQGRFGGMLDLEQRDCGYRLVVAR